ncbi:PREDICTED: probable citrate synthase 2, mitochondrial isoform X1 [Trachymyrmex cornetzi]|uniref:probable citrate synthase 2, mitochondrial isoform X1 n=1 Tax=Trachymyrmex cornetzi TaxID=471704 RepID=UPI00084F7CB5|nr:PREDICTED: probable citrate synthase 2, mitochondrial isoform X1 [Trachymyrmex cornetzi]
MLRLSRGLRCEKAYLFVLWNRRRSCITQFPGDRKVNFGTGERHVLTVSKTRGEPSTSTNLKEALCEKIPVHHDLLRNFRLHFGPSVVSQITVENLYTGLNDIKTIVKETSELDPKHGIVYRGLTIPEVIGLLPREGNSPSAEAVFWLLLTGDVPTQQQTASLIADWTLRRKKCTEWWSGPRGETIASVLRSMPEIITPLHRLSVALTIFNISKQAKEAKKHGAMPYTYWEYIYEDGMEFLATLPAIIGLIAKGQTLTNVSGDGDWVQFLLDCLRNVNENLDGRKSSIVDFLRLYITLNADDDGGAPIAHVTQILGSTDLHINEVLASTVLAHVEEPKSGTMLEWKKLQTKIKNTLGRTWTEDALKTCVLNLLSRDKLIGHKEADFCDPRYTALLHYAKQHLPNNSEIKLSEDITRILRTTIRRPKRKDIYPEQNALAPVIFQYYGLEDMRFNQIILYMARTLGAIASIIWTKIVNAPIEHPISSCTYSYIESVHDNGIKKRKRRTRNADANKKYMGK